MPNSNTIIFTIPKENISNLRADLNKQVEAFLPLFSDVKVSRPASHVLTQCNVALSEFKTSKSYENVRQRIQDWLKKGRGTSSAVGSKLGNALANDVCLARPVRLFGVVVHNTAEAVSAAGFVGLVAGLLGESLAYEIVPQGATLSRFIAFKAIHTRLGPLVPKVTSTATGFPSLDAYTWQIKRVVKSLVLPLTSVRLVIGSDPTPHQVASLLSRLPVAEEDTDGATPGQLESQFGEFISAGVADLSCLPHTEKLDSFSELKTEDSVDGPVLGQKNTLTTSLFDTVIDSGVEVFARKVTLDKIHYHCAPGTNAYQFSAGSSEGRTSYTFGGAEAILAKEILVGEAKAFFDRGEMISSKSETGDFDSADSVADVKPDETVAVLVQLRILAGSVYAAGRRAQSLALLMDSLVKYDRLGLVDELSDIMVRYWPIAGTSLLDLTGSDVEVQNPYDTLRGTAVAKVNERIIDDSGLPTTSKSDGDALGGTTIDVHSTFDPRCNWKIFGDLASKLSKQIAKAQEKAKNGAVSEDGLAMAIPDVTEFEIRFASKTAKVSQRLQQDSYEPTGLVRDPMVDSTGRIESLRLISSISFSSQGASV